MKATIFIDRLRVHALIGVDAQERVVGNDFEVSVSVEYAAAAEAGLTDSLAGTISYADVASAVKHVMSKEMNLVEHAARMIIEEIIARWPAVSAVSVTVAKLAPPVPGTECATMGVTFQWSR